MKKGHLVGAFVCLLTIGLAASCITRGKMTGTYEGEWEGGGDDEIEITPDGPGAILIECDDCVIDEDFEAEITGGSEFEIEDSNVDLETQQFTDSVELEGEGTVEQRELEMEIDVEFSDGSTSNFEFEGDKE